MKRIIEIEKYSCKYCGKLLYRQYQNGTRIYEKTETPDTVINKDGEVFHKKCSP